MSMAKSTDKSASPSGVSGVAEPLDLEEVRAGLYEASASGLIDGPDAPYNWAALRAMRTAERLLAEVARQRETLRGLLAFYDAALDCVTLDAGEQLIVDGTRVSNVVSLIEADESVRFDAALDAAEPHAEVARALLAGDQS